VAKKKKPADPLIDMLAAVQPETLINLIEQLAAGRPEVRRECFDYLKKHGSLTANRNPARTVRSHWRFGGSCTPIWKRWTSAVEQIMGQRIRSGA